MSSTKFIKYLIFPIDRIGLQNYNSINRIGLRNYNNINRIGGTLLIILLYYRYNEVNDGEFHESARGKAAENP